MLRRSLCALVALVFVACQASAQITQYTDPTSNNIAAPVVPLVNCDKGGGNCQPVSSSHPMPISGSFSASLSGFTPTPAYATLSVGASSARVALPSGVTVIVFNTGSNDASVNLGDGTVVATGTMNIIKSGQWLSFTVSTFVDLAAIEATGAGGTTSLVISGGSGLPTGAGGSGSGGGGGSNASVSTTGTTPPGSATYIGMQTVGGSLVGPAGSIWGSAPTGVQVLGVNADILNSVLPTGAATAANQCGWNSSNPCIFTPSNVTPTNVNATGSVTTIGLINANASAKIDTASSGAAQIVAAVSGKAIYVTSWNAIANGTTNFTFEYGTGTNCASGTQTLTGAYGLVAQFGAGFGAGIGSILVVPANNALCIVNSASVQVSGSLSYLQQ